MPHATVKRVRLRYTSDALRCDVSMGIGYRATCTCGWSGKRRRHRAVAVADKIEHASEHQP